MAVTLYWIVQAAATAAPSEVQVKNGQDGTGAAALAFGSEAYSGANTYSEASPFSGLTAGQDYKQYWVAHDGSTYSAVEASATIKTAVAVGLSTSTDSALARTASLLRAVGLSSESSSAIALSPTLSRATGLSAETDSSLAISAQLSRATGLSSEADSSIALAAGSSTSAGLSAETDSALACAALAIRAAGLSTESESALAAAVTLIRPAGLSAETEAALALDVVASTIKRPASDLSAGGWTPSTGTDLFATLDEAVADDGDYIISPGLSGSALPVKMGLTGSLAAGSYTISVRAKTTSGAAAMRVALLNDADAQQGISADQAIDAIMTTYALPVTISGTATRVQLEVQ